MSFALRVALLVGQKIAQYFRARPMNETTLAVDAASRAAFHLNRYG